MVVEEIKSIHIGDVYHRILNREFSLEIITIIGCAPLQQREHEKGISSLNCNNL